MSQPPGSGHLDLDELAELEEGLVPADAATVMRTHLETCAECRDLLSRLRTTRALVSTLPPVAMPVEVAARVDAALAHEAESSGPGSRTVVPLEPRRRWLRSPTLAGFAAGVAIVLLAAGVLAGRLVHPHDSTGSGGSSASNAAGGTALAPSHPLKVWHTGADYSPASIPSLVPGLVTGTPTAGADSTTGSVTGGATGATGGAGASAGSTATAGGTASPTAPKATGRVPATAPQPAASSSGYSYAQLNASRPALLSCARILNGGTPVVPLAVDFAQFAGAPAVVFVLPTIGHADSVDVWVVRSTCGESSFDLYFRRVVHSG